MNMHNEDHKCVLMVLIVQWALFRLGVYRVAAIRLQCHQCSIAGAFAAAEPILRVL
jgi:hypothetical protein